MEGLPTNEGKKIIVPYEQSFVLAAKLWEEHRAELILADNENFGQRNTPIIIAQLPEEITERFWGHGITKVGPSFSREDRLAAFINILDNDTVKGSYGRLAGGPYGAYTNSDFLILSLCDKELGVNEGDAEDGKRLVKNEVGWVANIGAYVVSNKYYPVLTELKRLYPDKNIIRADEVPEYLSQEIARAASV